MQTSTKLDTTGEPGRPRPWRLNYRSTRIPETPTAWSRMNAGHRNALIFGLWVFTEALLVIGLVDPRAYHVLVAFSFAHALLFTALVGGRPLVFPAQLRIAYFTWVAVGTYVPGTMSLMYITTVGLLANLAVGYCPLARLLYLLPYNRQHTLTWRLAWRTFVQPPSSGRFRLDPAVVAAERR